MKKSTFQACYCCFLLFLFSQTATYSGNGNYGFNGNVGGGPIGSSVLTINYDGTRLNFTLVTPFSTNNANVNISGNVLAIYIDNGSGGGFNNTTSFVDQTPGSKSVADGLAAVYGGNVAPLTFPVNFNAQYGLGISSEYNTPPVLVAKLVGGGAFTNQVTPIITTDHDSTTFEFSILPSDIGLSGSSFSFRFFGSLISNDAYRSNEAIGMNVGGDLGGGANIGFSAYTDTTAPLVFTAGSLAVNFGSFNGYFKNNAVNLTWNTATESNLSQFQVLKSTNSASWNTIGIVAAKNASVGAQYSFTDNNPNATNYYQLKSLDKDGKINYSTVLIINAAGKHNITLNGNPVKNAINLNISDDNAAAYHLTLYSSDGKILVSQVFNHTSGTDKATINLPSFAKGMCLLRVSSNNSVQTFRVMVQ